MWWLCVSKGGVTVIEVRVYMISCCNSSEEVGEWMLMYV
jgi:hypothetical protein